MEAEKAGVRIDVHASEKTGFTRSRIQHLIEGGLLRVNNVRVKQNYRTRPGDSVLIEIPETDDKEKLIPEKLPVDILYKDEYVVVVDKPAGMVVYPSAGHHSGTLLNAIAYHSSRLAFVGAPLRPGVVHRLDKDTSGVMVVALEDRAYYGLVEQFRMRSIKRNYKALVYGNVKADGGEIALKIGRSESERKKMSTKSKKGKEAVTKWKVAERFTGATLVEAKLGTGRTHQIRVHFASSGHPVLGDRTYGKKTSIEIRKVKITFPRQMLHAELLGFSHPETGQYMEFRSPLPEDMEESIRALRNLK